MMWMRSSLVVLERLTANAEVAPVLGSIPASSDTVKSKMLVVRASDSQCRIRTNPGFDPKILRHSLRGGR
jgi:hypothetical protein